MSDNLSASIREWLAAQPGPVTSSQVHDAVDPDGPRWRASTLLSSMVASGLAESAKLAGTQYFVIGRPPIPRHKAAPAKTGRSQRVRDLLAANARGYTVGEIRAQIDPNATASQVSATLYQLAERKHIFRANVGHLSCYARDQQLADAQLAAELAARHARKQKKHQPKRATKTPELVTAVRTPTPAPTQAPAPRRLPSPPARSVPRGVASAPPLAPRTATRTTATCALHGIPQANAAARERIASDVDAFLAAGGKIERLGVTQIFHHAADNDD